MFADGEYIRVFHPSGVWESSDGKSWRQTSLTNIVKNQAFLDYVVFKGAVYALGTFEGNIGRFTQTSQIARTTDFRTWEILAAESNLPERFFYHPFVFQDKIWIIGGEIRREAMRTRGYQQMPFAGQRSPTIFPSGKKGERDLWFSRINSTCSGMMSGCPRTVWNGQCSLRVSQKETSLDIRWRSSMTRFGWSVAAEAAGSGAKFSTHQTALRGKKNGLPGRLAAQPQPLFSGIR